MRVTRLPKTTGCRCLLIHCICRSLKHGCRYRKPGHVQNSRKLTMSHHTHNCHARYPEKPLQMGPMLINTQFCHHSGCFECILSLGVHSSEAVLAHRSDATHENWHNRHKDSEIYYKSLPEVEEAEKRGTRCDLFSKLVVTARRFTTCMPSDPEHTKCGWYDKSRYIANSLVSVEFRAATSI